jgi:hypothetical protein
MVCVKVEVVVSLQRELALACHRKVTLLVADAESTPH